jgi:RNA polymerase sigma-32 factor
LASRPPSPRRPQRRPSDDDRAARGTESALEDADGRDSVEPEPASDSDEDGPTETEDADDVETIEAEASLVEEYDSAEPESQSARALAVVPHRDSLERPDPITIYMREVQKHPLLTREEEHQLAVLYHETGDVEAAKKLVTSNLRLVVKIAYEYKRAYKNMMDLVQEGNIGLMHAVKRFDPHRGVKLSSYSAWWIRAYILRFILNNWRLVKLGTTQAQRKLFFNLNRERARLSALGIEPTHDEIAKRLEVDRKDVVEMDLRLSAGDASLDAPVGEGDGRKVSRVELLKETSAGPDRLIEQGELLMMLKEHLETFRETLSGKELEIFEQRMIADEPLTLQELGDSFGVTRERVRQLEARVAGRLRVFLQECLGDATEIDSD